MAEKTNFRIIIDYADEEINVHFDDTGVDLRQALITMHKAEEALLKRFILEVNKRFEEDQKRIVVPRGPLPPNLKRN